MLLRRVIEHVNAQNWMAVFIDVVIVIVGVFLGLQVQGWAEEQGRGKLEAAYTERLHDEVVELEEIREPLVEMRVRWRAGMASVVPALFGNVARTISEEECQSIALSYIVSNPTDDLASLVELQSSGQLSVFRNRLVSEALRSFLLTRARARDSQAGISRSVRFLASEYPELIQIASPTRVTDTLSVPAIYRCDADGMRATPAFLNDFEINQSNFAFHVADNARVGQSLADLHRVLDGVLGLEHATQLQAPL
jgi:hypothetical protein